MRALVKKGLGFWHKKLFLFVKILFRPVFRLVFHPVFHLVFLLTGAFIAPSFSEELKALDYFVCEKKTATEILSRTIRVHYFPKIKKCAVIYSVKGQDRLISSGKWLAFCRRRAREQAEKIQKRLWACQQISQIEVFYASDKKPD